MTQPRVCDGCGWVAVLVLTAGRWLCWSCCDDAEEIDIDESADNLEDIDP